jgi:hypothetical protein
VPEHGFALPNIEPRAEERKKSNRDKLHRLDGCLVKVASFSHKPWSSLLENGVSDLSMDIWECWRGRRGAGAPLD